MRALGTKAMKDLYDHFLYILLWSWFFYIGFVIQSIAVWLKINILGWPLIQCNSCFLVYLLKFVIFYSNSVKKTMSSISKANLILFRFEDVWTPLLFSTEIRSCINISEDLQTRDSLNENQIREHQEASAKLEAKRRQNEERIRQAGTTKQQLQDQLLQLQTEELQLKNEEVQAKTENLEAKSALQKAEGEKAQLNNEISLHTQELHLAKEQNKQIETQISSTRQKVTQSTRTKNELTQGKDTKAAMKSSLSQNLKEEETLIKRLSDENSRLEEDIERTRGTVANLTRAKAELEEKLNALNIQKEELKKGIQRAGESEKSVQASITRVGQEIQKIEDEIGDVASNFQDCFWPIVSQSSMYGKN